MQAQRQDNRARLSVCCYKICILVLTFFWWCKFWLEYLIQFRVLFWISRSHQDMSVKMIDYIVDENNIEVDPETLKRVKVNLLYYEYSNYFFNSLILLEQCFFKKLEPSM